MIRSTSTKMGILLIDNCTKEAFLLSGWEYSSLPLIGCTNIFSMTTLSSTEAKNEVSVLQMPSILSPSAANNFSLYDSIGKDSTKGCLGIRQGIRNGAHTFEGFRLRF